MNEVIRGLGLQTFEQIDRYLESKRDRTPANLQTAGPIQQSNYDKNQIKGKPKVNEKTKARDHRAKETAKGIAKGIGYEELNDREKELCITLTIQPSVFLDLKKKLIEKTSCGKHKLKRGIVVSMIGKEISKDKAFVIFDFLRIHKVISSKD